MKVLVTGDKGFVGSATTKYLKEIGVEVEGYDIMDGYDIRDRSQFRIFVAETRPDRILHLAAIARFEDSDRDPMLAYETNVLGTQNVVTVAGEEHIPLVYSSTGSVYMPVLEDPPITESFRCCGNSVYGVTKYLGELCVRRHTPHIVLRYAHLYGKEKRGHGLVGAFVARIERGLAPTLYGGKQSNDFTYIDDVARANALALSATWDRWNQVYNIGTGEELTAARAGELICSALGYEGKVEVRDGRTVDPQRFVFDVSKAKRLLGFTASYSFEAGLKAMLKESVPELSVR